MDNKYPYLDRVNSPIDLKKLDESDIHGLISDIRSFLIEKVERTGGHLASNLGVVELSVALHRVFDSPTDHIIFDVGHQSYIHKILTGRRGEFDTLRVPGGLSGFTSKKESPHDAFGAGHSSTSLSAALGYAEGDRLVGRECHTVCVIGDGAYTGGMIHEALNNCPPDLPIVIVLNENGMSISKNRGAFASYLSRVRVSRGYIDWKRHTNNFLSKIPLGSLIQSLLAFMKRALKRLLFRPNYFEQLGYFYLGPIDGNDYKKTERALRLAKNTGRCVIVHLKTKKGKGHEAAEREPESFHSLAHASRGVTFHEALSPMLISLAKADSRVVAVTAAMGVGTGLSAFAEAMPERYFDVGIAEEHALTFAAGLAASGIKPYVAVYSTFLQRAYDNLLHDIALQSLPVKILVDRAGLSLGDGATHHGIFDVAFLSHIPGMTVIAPPTHGSLEYALGYSLDFPTPIAIRYPNLPESELVCETFFSEKNYNSLLPRCDFDRNNPPKNIFVTYGSLTDTVLSAECELRALGYDVGTVLLTQLFPLDTGAELIASFIRFGSRVVFAEEGICTGGAASQLLLALNRCGVELGADTYRIAAIMDSFAAPDTVCDLYDYVGLSKEKLKRYFLNDESK